MINQEENQLTNERQKMTVRERSELKLKVLEAERALMEVRMGVLALAGVDEQIAEIQTALRNLDKDAPKDTPGRATTESVIARSESFNSCGQVAYEAYYAFVEGKGIKGDKLPQWSGVPVDIKLAWSVAACVVLDKFAPGWACQSTALDNLRELADEASRMEAIKAQKAPGFLSGFPDATDQFLAERRRKWAAEHAREIDPSRSCIEKSAT